MPWKSACDIRFHEVLQTTIIRQVTNTYIYIYIALSQILSTLQILLHFVCHKPTKGICDN